MRPTIDQDQQVERKLEKAKLIREGSYGFLAAALYTALVILNQDNVISLPAWLLWETPALEAKAITFLAAFVGMQSMAKDIELDAEHDSHQS